MRTPQERLLILEHAHASGCVALTCQTYGLSRTLFYRWKRRYEALGLKGLEDQIPKKPVMPNQVCPIVEAAILHQVCLTPKDGPRQLYYALSHQGHTVGETGVYNVLKRHGLNHRRARMAYVHNQMTEKQDLRQLAKLDLKLKLKKNRVPGYLAMETLRAWYPPNSSEPIFFYALYEACSQWGMIKLFPKKSKIQLAQVYQHQVTPLIKTFKLPLTNILSDQLPEFKSQWDHRWQMGQSYQAPHFKSCFWTLPQNKRELAAPLDAFIEQIVSAVEKCLCDSSADCEAPAFKLSFEKLERCFSDCLKTYNFKPAQKECPTPADVIMTHIKDQGIDPETLPLWVHLRMV